MNEMMDTLEGLAARAERAEKLALERLAALNTATDERDTAQAQVKAAKDIDTLNKTLLANAQSEVLELQRQLYEADEDYQMAASQVRAAGRFERYEVRYLHNPLASELAALLDGGWRVAFEAYQPADHFVRLEREAVKPQPEKRVAVEKAIDEAVRAALEDAPVLTMGELDRILFAEVPVATPLPTPTPAPRRPVPVQAASVTAMLTADFVREETAPRPMLEHEKRVRSLKGRGSLSALIDQLPMASHIRDHGKDDAIALMNEQMAAKMRAAYEDRLAANGAFVLTLPALGSSTPEVTL